MLQNRTLEELLSINVQSGAAILDSEFNYIGVDFSNTSNSFSNGSKTFFLKAELSSDRKWFNGQRVKASSNSGFLLGEVSSYNKETQELTILVNSFLGDGSNSSWRIGSIELRRDSNGSLIIEPTVTNNTSFSITNNGVSTLEVASEVSYYGFPRPPFRFSRGSQSTPADLSGSQLFFSDLSVLPGEKTTHTFYVSKETANFCAIGAVNGSTIDAQGLLLGFNFTTKQFFSIRTSTRYSSFLSTYKEIKQNLFEIKIVIQWNFSGNVFSCVHGLETSNINDIGSSSFLFRGLMLQSGDLEITYIPTDDQSVTKLGEICQLTTLANSKLITEKTVLIEFDKSNYDSNNSIFYSKGGSNEFRVSENRLNYSSNITNISNYGEGILIDHLNGLEYIKNGLIKKVSPTSEISNTIEYPTNNKSINFSENKFLTISRNNETIIDLSTGITEEIGILSNRTFATNINRVHYTGERFIFITTMQKTLIYSDDGFTFRFRVFENLTNLQGAVSGVVGGILTTVLVGTQGSKFYTIDGGETYESISPLNSQLLNTGAFGNLGGVGKFIVVGDNTIQTSTDGINWQLAAGFPNRNYNSVHIANGVAVAVASSGTIIVSTDGLTWTASTFSGTTTTGFNEVIYYQPSNIWVAIGTFSVIYTSSNPSGSWTLRSSGLPNNIANFLNAITVYQNSLYIFGPAGIALRSNNGTTWSQVSIINEVSINRVANSADRLVITRGTVSGATETINMGIIYSNEDLTLSTFKRRSKFINDVITHVCNGDSGALSVGKNGYKAKINTTNKTFTRINNGNNFSSTFCKFVNGFYYVLSNNNVERSADLVNWQTFQIPSFTNLQDIIFAENLFILVGDNGYATSTDGLNFSGKIIISSDITTVNSIEYLSGFLHIVCEQTGNQNAKIFRGVISSPSVVWTLYSGTHNFKILKTIKKLSKGNILYSAGVDSEFVFSTNNGVNWERLNDKTKLYLTSSTEQKIIDFDPFVGKNRLAFSRSSSGEFAISINGVSISDNFTQPNLYDETYLADLFNGKISFLKVFDGAFNTQILNSITEV